MADIAATFHWPLSEMLALPLEDLLHWRELAIERWNRMWGKAEE